jgi:hypothetical protein
VIMESNCDLHLDLPPHPPVPRGEKRGREDAVEKEQPQEDREVGENKDWKPYIPRACLQANVDGEYNCASMTTDCNCIDDYRSEDDIELEELGLLTREDIQRRSSFFSLKSEQGPNCKNIVAFDP